MGRANVQQPWLPHLSARLIMKWLSAVAAHCIVITTGGIFPDLFSGKRKQLEEALQQTREALELAEENYRSICTRSIEGIFRTTPDGRYLSANPALARIYGYDSPEELIHSLTDISRKLYVEPQRRAAFVQMMEQHETVSEFESQIYRKDGSIIWISENAHICRNPDGSVRYYEGFVHDITHRKQTETELSHSEARHRALLNAIPDSIFRIGRDGTFLDHKPGKDSIEFTLTDEFLGRTVREVLPVAIAESVIQHIEAALESSETQVFEYRMPLQNDMRDYEARIVISGADEVMTIVRDITDRKHSDRLKNEFVSIVSHELRTPLTSIRGSLGLIMGGVAGDLPQQASVMLDIAYKNSERLVGLVNDILDIEKIESGKMVFDLRPLNLVDLTNQALESNQGYGEQYGVTFVLKAHPNTTDLKVNVDPDRLLQVFNNLLSNAAKFSPRDSSVEVAVVRRNGIVQVAVRDQGCGIPEEVRGRIFQKFVQADSSATRQKGGTGLGLSISRAIIDKLGGHIWFETEVDVGTTFFFELPIWEVVVDVTSGQPRVLICEDTPDLATLLSVVLSYGGFSTDIAYDTTQAKQLLVYNYYDAMTLDILMPGQDGISFIRELRSQEKTRYLPIVVVSALAQQGREQLEGGAFGVVDWLEKPIDQQRLIAAVKQAVRQQTGIQSRILHIEDDTDVLQIISLVLRDIADVVPACTLEQARQQIMHEKFDLILLDLSLPDGSGLELLTFLNGMKKQSMPVVVFSAHEVSQEVAQKVARALVKSRTSNQELLDTISALIQRNRSQRTAT